MLEGPVGSTLLRLALPMMMSIVSVMLINIVDTFYIGQLGVRELAAISFTFPVIFTVISLAFGVGMGPLLCFLAPSEKGIWSEFGN